MVEAAEVQGVVGVAAGAVQIQVEEGEVVLEKVLVALPKSQISLGLPERRHDNIYLKCPRLAQELVTTRS